MSKLMMNSIKEKATPIFNDLGVQINVDTLTSVMKRVSEQQFYTLRPSDYVPVNVDINGNWGTQVLTFKSSYISNGFEEGVIDVGSDNDRLATVSASLEPVYTPVYDWAKQVNYSLTELHMLAQGNWNIVEEKEKARKKDWDLGIQKIAFEGYKTSKGLLNQTGVTEDVTTITKSIKSMTAAEFGALIAGLIPAFRTNCNFTAMPNTLVMPEDDFNGLATCADETYPMRTKLQRLEDSFRMITGTDFKILPCVYASKVYNGSKNIYALYTREEDIIRMDLPVDYTITAANTVNGYQYSNAAYGRFTGVTLIKPKQFIYFTNTATY